MSRSNRGGSLSAGAGRAERGLAAFSADRTAGLLSRGEGGETGGGALCPPAGAIPVPAGGGTTTLDGSGGGMAGAGGIAPATGLTGRGGGRETEAIPAAGTDDGSGGGCSGGGSGDRSSGGGCSGAWLLPPVERGGRGGGVPPSTGRACNAGEEAASGEERSAKRAVGLLSTSGTRTSCPQRGQVVIMPAFRRVIDRRARQ